MNPPAASIQTDSAVFIGRLSQMNERPFFYDDLKVRSARLYNKQEVMVSFDLYLAECYDFF